MRRSKVVWSPTALSHFSAWVRYIARDSVPSAEGERNRLLKAVDQLKRFPRSGRIVPEFGNPHLRELIKKPIRIIYRLQGSDAEILTFHHSKRELDVSLFP